METVQCRGCGKKVIFAEDIATGSTQILDAVAPTYAVHVREDGVVQCTRTREGYVSHFATCLFASSFSKSKKAQRANAEPSVENKP